MFKPLLIAAVVFTGTAANATPTIRALFEAIKATGTEVVADHPSVCSDPNVMGMYQYTPRVMDRLTICIQNHKGDSAELRDTVLHESVHVAQACKGGPIFSPVSLVKAADPEDVVFLNQRYPQGQFITELEARVIARDQDEVYVTNLIKQHCK
jgi:hypothetical protein